MLFKINSENSDEGLTIACGVCPKQNINTTDGVLLQFGVSCVDNFSDLNQLRIECPIIDPNKFNTAIDNCKNVERLIVSQATQFSYATSNRCNIQCKAAYLAYIPTSSGSNSTTSTAFPIIVSAILFLMFISLKSIN